MSTTDTPRTDGQMESPNESTVPINFARTLEREADAYAKVLHDSLAREDALYKQLAAAQRAEAFLRTIGEALWLTWHKEALSCDELSQRNAADFDRGWNAGMAQAFRDRANWLQGICRQAGYEIPRQPEPNTEVRAELLTSQEVQRVAMENKS